MPDARPCPEPQPDMPPPRVRLLPTTAAVGAWHMAADEVMLQSAAGGVASLRFYRWSQPTLSLGYFQHAAESRAEPALSGLPWLRRATGGAALVHHHELTYALALPPDTPWRPGGGSWLCRMHGVIAAALTELGVGVRAVCAGQERKLGPVLCFLHQTPGDLLCGGDKVVGSAQRKQRGTLLQHGAVLLARSPYTPALPGLRELAGFPADGYDAVEDVVRAAFARDTGWELVPDTWRPDELRRAEALAAGKYGNPAWNGKR